MYSFFITGTDTGVGKTYFTAQLCNLFRQSGFDVGVMKPISTGRRSDARYLLRQTGLSDPLELINPIHFPSPVAPTIAAKLARKAFVYSRILSAYKKLKKIHKNGILVEGVGGVMVPLWRGYKVIDLAADLKIPVIIVSRPSIGTINHTLLTINALAAIKVKIAGFWINYNLPGSAPEDSFGKLTAKFSPRIIERASGVKEINLDAIKKHMGFISRGKEGLREGILFH